MISAIYGRNEKGEVIKDYGKVEVLLDFQKRFVWGVTLKPRTEGAIPANSMQKEGNALQCEQLVYEELKGCLDMSRGEWNEV